MPANQNLFVPNTAVKVEDEENNYLDVEYVDEFQQVEIRQVINEVGLNEPSFGDVTFDYHSLIVNEIALEGLDGITLQTLWLRLRNNCEWTLNVDDASVREFIWTSLLKCATFVDWYVLKEPRPQIVAGFIDDSFLYEYTTDTDLRPETSLHEIYPIAPIRVGDVMGSCSNFYSRIRVTNEIIGMTCKHAEQKYGARLIIVASQKVRRQAICQGEVETNIDWNENLYSILEVVGRTRSCGESRSYITTKINNGCYLLDCLEEKNLICKKVFWISVKGKKVERHSIYLPRFFCMDVPDYYSTLIARIVQYLQKLPQQKCLYSHLKQVGILPLWKNLRYKWFKRNSSSKFFTFHPNGEISLKKMKNRNAYKMNKVYDYLGNLEEIDLSEDDLDDADLDAISDQGAYSDNSSSLSLRLDGSCSSSGGEESYGGGGYSCESEEEEEDEEDGNINSHEEADLDIDMPNYSAATRSIYKAIKSFNVQGVDFATLRKITHLDKLTCKSLLRNLIKCEQIVMLEEDRGRQHICKYFLAKYEAELKDAISVGISKVLTFKRSSDDAFLNDSVEFASKKSKMAHSSKHVIKEESEDNGDDEGQVFEMVIPNTPPLVNENETSLDCDMDADVEVDVKPFVENLERKVIQHGIVRRSSFLIDFIYKNEVVEGVFDMIKFVKQVEASVSTPCRKSINRLLHCLISDGKVKKIEKTLSVGPLHNKTFTFYCAPHVTEDHLSIQMAMQNRLEGSWSKDKPNVNFMRNNTRCVAPKCVRIKKMHEFLYFLLHEMEQMPPLVDQEKFQKMVVDRLPGMKGEIIPPAYKDRISWDTFVPPLLERKEKGAITVLEVMAKMPLELFVQVIYTKQGLPNIDQYLAHPIKRFYLLQHLPEHVQNIIKWKKKHLYSAVHVVKYLCGMGLAQIGPKPPRFMAAQLIYLNKTATILDTTSCPPSYMFLNLNEVYPKLEYYFDTKQDLEKYWNDCERICLHTHLGVKSEAVGKEFVLEKWDAKSEILAACTPSHNFEANDVGKIPGDGLGAGGFDSAFNLHDKRCWAHRMPAIQKDELDDFKETKKRGVDRNNFRGIKVQPKLIKNKMEENNVSLWARRPLPPEQRKFYEERDVEALEQLMTKRTTWNEEEDNDLIMYWICMQFLQVIPTNCFHYRVMAQTLRKHNQNFCDKTGMACNRRLKSLLSCHSRFVAANARIEELRNNAEIRRKFQEEMDKMKILWEKKNMSELFDFMDEQTECVFLYLKENYHDNSSAFHGDRNNSFIPKTLEEFKRSCTYKFVTPKPTPKHFPDAEKYHKNVSSHANLHNIFTAALLTHFKKAEKISEHLSVFLQKYSSMDLISCVQFMLDSKMITSVKSVESKRYPPCAFLSFSTSTYYQLSQCFWQSMGVNISPAFIAQIYTMYHTWSSTCRELNLVQRSKMVNTILFSRFLREKVKFEIKCNLDESLDSSLENALDNRRMDFVELNMNLVETSCEISFEPDKDAYEYLREKCRKFVQKRSTFILLSGSKEEIGLNASSHFSLRNRSFANQIMNFILTNGEAGATIEDLRNAFPNLARLKSVVDVLTTRNFVLRTGCSHTRYIHNLFAENWLVFKEGKKKDLGVSWRPWISIQESRLEEDVLHFFLNRVLDKILHAPSISLASLQNIFLPSLEPHCSKELVEILEFINVVKLYGIERSRPSLFSRTDSIVKTSKYTGFEPETNVIIVPDADALVNFSLFVKNENLCDLKKLHKRWYQSIQLEDI